MDDKPMDKQDILNELEELHALDHDYSDGRILGSMCTEAHPFAKEVFCKFLDTNLGDPGLFKGTKQIENMVIKSIGELLSLDNAYGNIVTGGTEANLMAIRAARNHARKYKGIVDGEIIIPDSAHFSFKKAADMLNLRIVEAKLDENYKIDVDSVREAITDKTVAIVAIAGTTELGLIDRLGKSPRLPMKTIFISMSTLHSGVFQFHF